MRHALLPILVTLAILPLASAQAPATIHSTLTIEVEQDHAETMTLTFEGLRPVTRYDGLCLPQGARETRVYDAAGDMTYDGKDENGRRVLSILARSATVHVAMERAAPEGNDHPLYAADANFCVPQGSDVAVVVKVPEDHTLFFMSDAGKITNGREGRVESPGPTHVFYSYEAPLSAKSLMRVIDERPFRIYVAEHLVEQAQEVGQRAARPYQAALAEAGLPAPFDSMRVLFTDTTPHAWEAGHYNGHGYVTVKNDALEPDPTKGYPYSAVKVLVHESFHAASFPYGKGPVTDNIAWWLEGTARHSERHVDRAMPNATIHCEKTDAEVKCWEFDDRITRAQLDHAYSPTFEFEKGWEPSQPQSDDTRRLYYSYSEYAVAAWIERFGEESYRDVWDQVTAGFEDGAGCPCGEGWLERILDDDAFFLPWNDVRSSDPTRFDALVRPHLKDEEALQRALDAHTGPLDGLGVPAPGLWGVAIGAAGALALARRQLASR